MPLPQQFIDAITEVPGFDEAAFRAVHESGEQVTSVRINPRKLNRQQAGQHFSSMNVAVSAIPWCDDGLYLDERPSFIFDPLLHAGAYYVQEASSMFLRHVLETLIDKNQHRVVLDLCAAPGGKSTLLSSFFEKGLVVSNEVIKSRAGILQENVTKWGDPNVVVTSNDSRDFSALKGFFDVIVADVPCSGSGLFRKDPSAIEEWSPGNVQLCCQRQQRILADIIPCLNEDGMLIYSTCSYSREEDEDILDWIVDEFQLEPLPVNLPSDWNITSSVSNRTSATGYRFFPDKVKGEGFFLAAFRQTNSAGRSRNRDGSLTMATAREKEMLSPFIQSDLAACFKHNEMFTVFPPGFLHELKVLSNSLYIRQAGVSAGSFKGKSFVPHHALATSNIPHSFPRAELTKEQALSYLRKQDIQVSADQGWCLVTHKNRGLGWIKNLPNRTNNYYPSEWRILKS